MAMIKKLFLTNLMLFVLYSGAVYSQTNRVTKDDALRIAKQHFSGRDVDYYLLKDDNTTEWTIFVDAEPMKGWEHECYTLTIPKASSTIISDGIPVNEVRRSLPPAGDFTPLSVVNRYGAKANSKPLINTNQTSNTNNPVAQRTFAVILSGGVNKLSNYERYWNDCSFIYQTLVKKYGIPKNNIYPIMSDGDNPAEDMRTTSGVFRTQSLDLDFDGVDEISLSATVSNVGAVLNNLASKLQMDDHLFLFVIDHGGTNDNTSSSYINLWNNEILYDYQLAGMVDRFTKKFVNVNVVLGQCYSGGFMDNLTKVGCVVATASTGSEPSWSCPDIPYDEFVYQWTCAVNEANHLNAPVYSDTDSNGRVTMKEAFEYARNNDRRTLEHPQFISIPCSTGEDLAFNNLALAVDLYIRDNPEDTGKEPNLTTDEFWKSPSICLRNNRDSIFQHENPYYTDDHNDAYAYVKVENRGKKIYTGGKFLIIYWAQASTGLTQKAWKGREVYTDENNAVQYPTGGAMEATYIDTIQAGGYRYVEVRWPLPRLMENYPNGNFHFCLLAKVMDTPYDDGYADGKTYFNIRGSNKQVQKNVTIIKKQDLSKGVYVYVRNTSPSSKGYTLEFVPHSAADEELFSNATISLEMSQKIYNAWERGGLKSQNIQSSTSSTNDVEQRTVVFTSPESKLQAVTLNENEFDKVFIKFDFFRVSAKSITYSIDLVQKDENGNIIGGETFIVEAPQQDFSQMVINSAQMDGGKVRLNVERNDLEHVKWLDDKGEVLGEEESVVVSPSGNGNNYSVIATTENGDIATGSISLDSECGILSISNAPSDNTLIVKLKSVAPDNSSILITSITDGTYKAMHNVPAGKDEISVDISQIPKGMYGVTYIIEGKVIEDRKVCIE